MEKDSAEEKANDNMDFQGYSLRDNPKKSWKSLGLDDGSSMAKFECKVCGKEFEAMKALFGHMRHHSGKEKKRVNCQECGRRFKSLKALTAHMRLHSVKFRASSKGKAGCGDPRQDLVLGTLTVRRKRSKRMRYSNTTTNSSSLSSLSEPYSSLDVEIDQDVEDAALCLMMLSRGVRTWSEFNSIMESSDDSETKDLHQNDKEISQIADGDDSVCIQKRRRLNKSDSLNVFSEKKIIECKELGSGNVTDKEVKVGSEASTDQELCRVDAESGFVLFDTKFEERISDEIINFRSTEVEPGQDSVEELDLSALGSINSTSCKDAMFDTCHAEAEPVVDSLNKLICTPLNSELSDDPQKSNQHKCRICSKTFKSHQALGGHQTIHRKSNSCAVEQIENCERISTSPEINAGCKLVNVENSEEQEMDGVKSYGSRGYKVYECQICSKVFASGQALGGHKRSHLSRDPETKDKQSALQLEYAVISGAVDVNLPTSNIVKVNGDVGVKSCWIGSDCKSETLLSLVAN